MFIKELLLVSHNKKILTHIEVMLGTVLFHEKVSIKNLVIMLCHQKPIQFKVNQFQQSQFSSTLQCNLRVGQSHLYKLTTNTSITSIYWKIWCQTTELEKKSSLGWANKTSFLLKCSIITKINFFILKYNQLFLILEYITQYFGIHSINISSANDQNIWIGPYKTF